MTLSTTTNKTIAQGNGVMTVFSFSFPVLASGDLVVIYTDSTGVETTLDPSVYTATGIGATSTGGTVTYPLSGSPIATGTTLTIMRVVTLSQGTAITSQGSFDASVLEAADDFQMMAAQQLDEKVNRSLMGPAGEAALAVLPAAVTRANQALVFDANGAPTVGSTTTATISAAMVPVVQAATLTAARQLLGGDASNMNPVVNPDSAVAQIGTSISTPNDNVYTGDGLRILCESNGDINWAQGSTAARLAATAKYGDEMQVVTANHKFGGLRVIEGKDVWNYRGQTAVFAATIYADTSLMNCKMAILQFTGTEDATTGDPISSWGADGTTPTLAASWAFVNTPATLAASTTPAQFYVTGAVSASMTNLALFVWNDDKATTANDRLVVSQWDLRIGATPEPFEAINYQRNLARCQRYAPVFDAALSANAIFGSGFAASTTIAGIVVPFKVATRIAPTGITASNPTNLLLAKLLTTVSAASIAFQASGVDLGQVNVTVAAGLTAGEACLLKAGNVNCRIEFTGARL